MDPVAARAQNQRKGRWAKQNKGQNPARWGAASDMIYDPTGALRYECDACICVHECCPHMKRDLDSCASVSLWCAALDCSACNDIRLFMRMVKIFTSFMCCFNPCLITGKVLQCLHCECRINTVALNRFSFPSQLDRNDKFVDINRDACLYPARFEAQLNLVAFWTS